MPITITPVMKRRRSIQRHSSRMNYDILIPIAILALLLLFMMMCWAHRNTGTALIRTLNQKRFISG